MVQTKSPSKSTRKDSVQELLPSIEPGIRKYLVIVSLDGKPAKRVLEATYKEITPSGILVFHVDRKEVIYAPGVWQIVEEISV